MGPNDLEIYEREASNWWKPGSKLSTLYYFNPPRFSYFDRFIPNWENLKVLDVGCGGGFTSEFLAKRGAIVSGIDLSKSLIETAKKHAEENGLSIDYRQGRAENLEYENESFDVVICVDAVEHVSDLKKVISEIHRVLKKGGLFLFDTINKTFKSKFITIWLLEWILRKIPPGVHDWKMFIKPERLNSPLLETGFRISRLKALR
jgi:2-polyprenyl-6-hydroxyphenyl methylase/3-demethylubiquinone-9 3-methyltransferase